MDPGNDDTSLSGALSSLKQRGSTLLVTGAVSETAHATLSRQLLGDPTEGPRSNVLVLTDDRYAAAADRLPDGARGAPDPDVVRVRKAHRSASATAGAEAGAISPVATVDADALEDLAVAIFDAIEAVESQRGDLRPAELRFAFDSLTPLFHLHGEEAVFKTLALLTHALTERRAMAHFHLPVDPDTKPAHLLKPLFDVFVELRWTNGDVQQRWHVRDANVVTDWLDL